MLKVSILSVFVAMFALILCGCTTVKYTGPTFSPTEKVEVFYDKSRITKPYKVMGKVTVSTWYSYDNHSLRSVLIEKAKACGADAILIHSISESIGKPARVSDNQIDNALLSAEDEGAEEAENMIETTGAEEQTTEAVDESQIVAEFLKYTEKK